MSRSFGKMAERLEDFVERAPKYDGELRRGVALSKPEEVKDLIERYSKGEKNKALESWTSEKFVLRALCLWQPVPESPPGLNRGREQHQGRTNQRDKRL